MQRAGPTLPRSERVYDLLSHVPIEAVLALMLLIAELATNPDPLGWTSLVEVAICLAGAVSRWRPAFAAALAIAAVVVLLLTQQLPGIGILGMHLVVLSWAAQGRRGTVALAALLLAISLPPTALWPAGGDQWVGGVIFFALLMAGTVLLGFTWRALERRLIAAERARADAVRDVRRSIARDLHDTVAQTDTLIAMKADEALAEPDVPAQTQAALRAIADLARESIQDMRALLHVLRADGDAPAWQVGDLDGFLETQREKLERAGFSVSLEFTDETVALRPALRQALGKFIAEGVNNVIKHAPAQANCRVALGRDGARLQASVISDAGHAGTGARDIGGLGLLGARERIEALGGEVDVEPGPKQWALRATLPIA